jgi:hypothetical protein
MLTPEAVWSHTFPIVFSFIYNQNVSTRNLTKGIGTLAPIMTWTEHADIAGGASSNLGLNIGHPDLICRRFFQFLQGNS